MSDEKEPRIGAVSCMRVHGGGEDYMKIEVSDKRGQKWIAELTLEDFAIAVTGGYADCALHKKNYD